MSRQPSLKPRKKPQQQRAHTMVVWILDAAARVLEKYSLEGFNTNRVAEVAGVSIGSLYQYFPNKDALTAALVEQHQTQLASEVASAISLSREKSLEEGVRALAQVAIRYQYQRPGLASALDFEERRLKLSVVSESARHLASTLETFLTVHKKTLRVKDLSEAARDLLNMTKALVESETVLDKASMKRLEERIVRAILGYLSYES
jgi:AcrR family transcriptional regulator